MLNIGRVLDVFQSVVVIAGIKHAVARFLISSNPNSFPPDLPFEYHPNPVVLLVQSLVFRRFPRSNTVLSVPKAVSMQSRLQLCPRKPNASCARNPEAINQYSKPMSLCVCSMGFRPPAQSVVIPSPNSLFPPALSSPCRHVNPSQPLVPCRKSVNLPIYIYIRGFTPPEC